MITDETLTQPAVAYAFGRHLGGAVVRNRLRRRLRELLRARADRLTPGCYLIGATSGATKLSWTDLAVQVDALLVRCAAKVSR